MEGRSRKNHEKTNNEARISDTRDNIAARILAKNIKLRTAPVQQDLKLVYGNPFFLLLQYVIDKFVKERSALNVKYNILYRITKGTKK